MPEQPGSISAYFYRLFEEHPEALESWSNDRVFHQFLQDHSGQALNARIMQALAHVKVALRKKSKQLRCSTWPREGPRPEHGEHTGLVEEVIDFAFSGQVLFAVGPVEETKEAWITNDLRLAVKTNGGEEAMAQFFLASDMDVSRWGNTALLAHNLQQDGGPELTIDEAKNELAWTWHDLQENLVAELIWTAEYHKRKDQRAIHDQLFVDFIHSPLERQLRQRFGEILPAVTPLEGWKSCGDHLANNVVSELWYCAENRAFNGLVDNFWERIFRLYKQGIWPCGWRGVYPQPGKFVAYRRAP
jgi:hypothetical protein